MALIFVHQKYVGALFFFAKNICGPQLLLINPLSWCQSTRNLSQAKKNKQAAAPEEKKCPWRLKNVIKTFKNIESHRVFF